MIMKTWLIYMHTNKTTGKAYIGQTCTSMTDRWAKHCYSATHRPEGHFHNAIRKYGKEDWESSILVDSIETLDEANILEAEYILKYDTIQSGYNITAGGDVVEATEKAKENMRKGCKEFYGTKDVRVRNIKTGEMLEGNPNDILRDLGYDKNIFRDLVNGRGRSMHGWVLDTPKNIGYVPIKKYWFVHEELGMDYASLDEMCRKYPNITGRGNLSGVISGTRKSHQGWKLISKEI